jgi:hypothetical protein
MTGTPKILCFTAHIVQALDDLRDKSDGEFREMLKQEIGILRGIEGPCLPAVKKTVKQGGKIVDGGVRID